MNNIKKTLFVLTMLIGHLVAAENKDATPLPELVIQSSDYVSFHRTSLVASGESLTFDGDFLVSGNAVFGHFDMVVVNDSGNVVNIVKSTDQAYKKDHGPKPRPIVLDIGMATGVVKVEVSFHEMRVNPDVGACVSK